MTKKIILIIFSLFILLLGISVIKASLINGVNISYFQNLLSNPGQSVIVSYFLTEITMSGSPIAGLFVSIGESIGLGQLSIAAGIVGTRLGVNLLLFILGFILFLRGKPLKKTMDIGVLQFLISFSITVVSIIFLILFLESEYVKLFAEYIIFNVSVFENLGFLDFITRIAVDIINLIGNNAYGILIGFFLLIGGLISFDKSFSFVNDKKSIRKLQQITTNSSAFLAGVFMTALSMSLSVSVAILLPLYTKGAIKKNHLIAYILGANITTLLDTIFLAIIAESSIGFHVILSFFVSVAIVSCLYMAGFKYYSRSILHFEEKILGNKIYFILFLIITLLLPIGVLVF